MTSFAWELVDRVRALAPELPTGLLAFDLASGPDPVAAAVAGGHRAVNPWDPFVDEALVARAHAAGLEVNIWTVDDPERIAALAALGVDAVITNVPDVARAVLAGPAWTAQRGMTRRRTSGSWRTARCSTSPR